MRSFLQPVPQLGDSWDFKFNPSPASVQIVVPKEFQEPALPTL